MAGNVARMGTRDTSRI